ncbi:MAG TPA: hypothetical protein H9810_05250 [Candidatus Gemmiger excrementavium]|uniref:Lipoprotein n=1 Tax=Candidatus Gemmiger excrementavium TaxID=2838608 RepID=A0A9D2F2X9_9FIRM|nr:hypothetical protein [Candidatus Gemmiger excrementavium]
MKKMVALLLATLFTALLLCGCSQYDGRYDDEEFLTDGMNHYAATMWSGNTRADGSYALHAGSFSGVHGLRSFTVEENDTLCEVTSTLTCTKGEAKLLLVDTDKKTLAAQWPLDGETTMSVTLPAGSYDLRIAGKSAGFDGQISLTLNGQAVDWDGVLESMAETLQDVLGAGGTLETSLRALQDAA